MRFALDSRRRLFASLGMLMVFAVLAGAAPGPAFAAAQDSQPQNKTGQDAGAAKQAQKGDEESPLFQAVKSSDAAAVQKLLADGADANVTDRYGASPLAFAADRGQLDIVKLLVEAGAEVNHKDSFYGGTALYWAAYHGRADVIVYLIEHGADDVTSALQTSVMRGKPAAVQAMLEHHEFSPSSLANTRRLAEQANQPELAKLLAAKESPAAETPAGAFDRFVGTYKDPAGNEIKLVVQDGALGVEVQPGTVSFLESAENNTFKMSETVTIKFEEAEGKVAAMVIVSGENETRIPRMAVAVGAADRDKPLVAPPLVPEWTPSLADRDVSSANWPQFRGTEARGIADGQGPPLKFNVPQGSNVAWKTPIPGLGHSCPVVWGDQVFITTAVSISNDKSLRTGAYGDFDSVDDNSPHRWQVICLDKRTGQVEWMRTACEGVPKFKRHLKSTHANPTCATNGEYVVASFGTEGIYCYSISGDLVWKSDLGPLNAGWFYDAAYQWGFGSSPVIHRDVLYLQCDVQDGSFVAAYDLATGKERWRTPREEIPSWGTPTVYETSRGPILITAASKFARAYNAETGEELWRLSGHSEIPVPTPFVAHDLVYITSGYRPIRPIYAVKLDAAGDISAEGTKQNPAIAWMNGNDGPYMPTPLVYGDYLYVCSNAGLLTCFAATTGQRVYRQRLARDGAQSFVGSLVAGDGRLYIASEEGNVIVLQAGPVFRELAFNPVGEACHATPAISQGLMILRTTDHVIAVGELPQRAADEVSSPETRAAGER